MYLLGRLWHLDDGKTCVGGGHNTTSHTVTCANIYLRLYCAATFNCVHVSQDSVVRVHFCFYCNRLKAEHQRSSTSETVTAPLWGRPQTGSRNLHLNVTPVKAEGRAEGNPTW